MTGIYIVTNLINKKAYIGQSHDLFRRAWEHYRCQCSNKSLSKAIQKYGTNNFSFGILSILPDSISKSKLFEIEDQWIALYDARNSRFGYNRRDSRTPWPDPESAKKKIVRALTGRVCSPETRERISKATMGRTSGMKGKHQSKESRQKAIQTQRERGILFGHAKGNWKPSPAHIQRLAEINRVRSSKTFIFTELSTGVKHLITGGFDPFCVEHNLSKTMMREVLNNKKENHRRWKVERATSKEE